MKDINKVVEESWLHPYYNKIYSTNPPATHYARRLRIRVIGKKEKWYNPYNEDSLDEKNPSR